MRKLQTTDFSRGPYLSISDFTKLFDEEWDKMEQRFTKYEALQFYDEGPNGPYHDYVAEKYESFVEKLIKVRLEDRPFYEAAAQRGASFSRLHAARRPFNKYMEFEYYSYFITSRYGDKIFYIDEDKVEKKFGFLPPDFVGFDKQAVIFQDFSHHGLLRGGWVCRETDVIDAVIQVFDDLVREAVSYDKFYKGDPLILRMIEERSSWTS